MFSLFPIMLVLCSNMSDTAIVRNILQFKCSVRILMMQAMIYTCTLVLSAISISLSAILKVN